VLVKNSMNVPALLGKRGSRISVQAAEQIKIIRTHVDAGERCCKRPPRFEGKRSIPVAQRLNDLRCPPAGAEILADVPRASGKCRLECLIHEVPHGRIRAFHEQTLKLNDGLNDPVGGRSAFGREDSRVLQRRQQCHGSPDRS
jgi:hypothetical protein